LKSDVCSVLVFGLPGSGKTHLINSLQEKLPHYERLSGGSLINAALTEEQRDSLRALSSSLVIGNQEILVFNYWRKIAEDNISHLFFDGHLMVRSSKEETIIPLEVIRKLSPRLMVFLDVPADKILSQRVADASRPDRASQNVRSLEEERCAQLGIFTDYGKALGVDTIVFSGRDIGALLEKIEKL
tara:strand:+ start:11881 stop:12438 length:558 start_codon:yes stop_codon:yes gene_type:complete